MAFFWVCRPIEYEGPRLRRHQHLAFDEKNQGTLSWDETGWQPLYALIKGIGIVHHGYTVLLVSS